MRLFSEKLKKHKFITLLVFIIMEIICFIVIFIKYKPIYSKIFEEMEEISITKTNSIIDTLKELMRVSFIRYILDLKLIGKHMSLLANDEININSNYYKNLNNDKSKNIYYGTLEELKQTFNEYYDDKQKKFFYFENYIENYIKNTTNMKNILNDLMNGTKHPELNSISYYKLNGSISDINSNQKKKISAKYLISILKTNILNRLSIQGEEFNILRYFLLTKDEIYIYPPEAYNNSLIYSALDNFTCNEYNFPSCMYKNICFIMESSSFIHDSDGYIQPIFPTSVFQGKDILNVLCLSIPFEEKIDSSDFYYVPKICMELNMTKMLSKGLFQSKEAFHFIFFAPIREDDLFLLNNGNTELFSDIQNVFNDSKFGKYSLINGYNNYFSLFHYLYLDLFKEFSLSKKNDISLDIIFQEYEEIKNKIFENLMDLFMSGEEYSVTDIEKTTCKSDIYNNGKKCNKDNFMVIVYLFANNYSLIDEYFVDIQNKTIRQELFYSMTIIDHNYSYFKWKLNQIIIIKILKLFLFFFMSSMCLIFLYFIFVQIFYENKFNTINKILNVIKGGSFFELKDKNEIIQKKKEILIKPNSKEMMEIKNLFDYLVKIMLFKINFEQNEQNLNKKETKTENIQEKNKNQITDDNNIMNRNINSLKNNNNIETLNEYFDLINNINNKEIRLMFFYMISYYHFKKGLYKLSENGFKNLIKEINHYQNKILKKDEDNDNKLKDSISRCSKISYLNEYSLTNELSEVILNIIKIKLLTQKIYYLYSLSIFIQEKLKSDNNKKYNIENAQKIYEEAIKYFIESKNISLSLGTDKIRQIFSLIMISKCYIELKNYKESMINLNEALLVFSDLQKSFQNKSYFNPKVMMFTENYIFQSIMLSIAQTTYTFNKYPQSCWILMKMIETSPFVFNDIHYQACFLLDNCLMQIQSFYNLPYRQIDKYRKKINKMFMRISVRLSFKEKRVNTEQRNNNNLISISSMSNNKVNTIGISLENILNNKLKTSRNKDMSTNKISVSINSLYYSRTKYKNISLCISEKYIQEIYGNELKDVIIKFFKKSFSNGIEKDKFNFIQFSCNGKKTVSIKSNSIEIFLQKLEKNKMAFKINDDLFQNNKQIQFMELSNLFMNIIKSHKHENYEDLVDNIIILFINTSDIRFNGQKECVDTINELNNNNYTVIIFTYDFEIDDDKIEGICSFIFGLNDGHFFQIKNYQIIKQVFTNLCIKDSQEKFNNYNYEITDCMI